MPTEIDPYVLYSLAVKLSWRLATQFNLDLNDVELICREHLKEYIGSDIYDELALRFGSVTAFDENLWETAVSNRLIKEALDDDGTADVPAKV